MNKIVERRHERHSDLAKIVRDGLEELEFKLLLPRNAVCSSITSVPTPVNIPYQVLHDKLNERGFIIYSSMGSMENKIFRIGNMGALTRRHYAIPRFNEIGYRGAWNPSKLLDRAPELL